MSKTIFEEMGGAYVRQGDYNLPCLSLPTEKENRLIGVWGQRHLRYLKQHRKVLYTNLLTSAASWTVILRILTNRRKICFFDW